MQCSGYCLLYPAETPDVIMSCNWWLPTPWSLRWDLCVMSKCTPEDAHHVYAIYVYVYNSHTDRTYSSLKTTLSSRLFYDTRVAMFGGVSGSLTRGIHHLSPGASRWFPMVLGHTAGATYVGCNFNFGNNAMQAKPDGVNCCNFCHVLRCVWPTSE